MISSKDQLGRTIHLQAYPQRILSVVPSQTELLFDLGLQEEVVGITKFCVHPPEWFRSKTKVGGTKTLKVEIIHSLHPDLIIANKEENTKEQIDVLAGRYPVWISDVNDLDSALQMIVSVGILTNKPQKASEITNQIRNNFSHLMKQLQTQNHQPQTAYLIWKDPYMTTGGDTFINAMLKVCGLKNVFEHLARYPIINISELQTSNCQVLLLSSEPYPFNQKHIAELQVNLPGTKIILVDGEMFSWYGSRLIQSAIYFQKLINEVYSP